MFSILCVSAQQCIWCSSVFFISFCESAPIIQCDVEYFLSRISSVILYILSVKVLRPRKHFARSNGPQVLRETNGRPNLFFFSLLGFSTDLPNAAGHKDAKGRLCPWNIVIENLTHPDKYYVDQVKVVVIIVRLYHRMTDHPLVRAGLVTLKWSEILKGKNMTSKMIR